MKVKWIKEWSINFNEDTDLELSLKTNTIKAVYRSILYKSNLEVFIKAAKLRQEPLDVLLFGPPGLVKLYQISLLMMDVNIQFRGPSLERPG